MKRHRVSAGVVGLVTAVLLAGCSGSGIERYGGFTFVSPGGQTELTYPAGERGTIGELTGPDLTSDGTIALSDYPDQVVVLNVWGSWCGPCRGEVDSLNLAATLTADQGVQFLGINVKDTRDAAPFSTTHRQELDNMDLSQRRRTRGFVVLLLTVIGFIGLTGTAAAHTELVSSDPADGTTLTQAPTSVTLTFNEPVQNLEPAVVITGPDGQTYPTSPPIVDSDVVRSDVIALGPPGPYTIAYRVISVDDHPVTGQVQFDLAVTAIPTTPVPAEAAATAAVISPPVAPSTTSQPAGSTTGDTGTSSSETPSPSGTSPSPTIAVQSGSASLGSKIPIWLWVVAFAVIATVLIAIQQRRSRRRP